MKKEKKLRWLSVVSVCAVILIWYLYTDVLHLVSEFVLPGPASVLDAFIEKLYTRTPDGSTLTEHLWASIQLALVGYSLGFVIGVPLGICMAWYPKFDKYARPLFDIIRPVPPIAWIPVIIVLFGIGLLPKAIIVFLASFTGFVVNAYAGIKNTKNIHLWVGRTYGATNRELLFHVAIPTAVPFILTGMQVSLASAWGSLVAAEMLASTQGLGFLIQHSRGIFKFDVIIVGMLSLGVVGAILSSGISLLRKKILKGGRW